ncbi:hypothetical protein C8D88_10174 [Lentzea atacamensis]|uniref:Uncharacterized protein n=1 Tax=Lentzea atacamensis TaxID=531938 RepID=A0A316IC00_9PSEU|nr:hypothetical protein [Lentzea atacamensis]PWK90066.1 hypothetical protein C8D88_10174 [Lentzea atacamensis]
MSVKFRPEALRLSPQALSRAVTTTLQQAVAQSARASAELVQRYPGDQVDIAARVNKMQEDVFGPAPELPQPPPMPPAPQQHRMPPPPPVRPQRHGPSPRVEDDDEGFGSILR